MTFNGKAYVGKDITVYYDANVCIHAAECVRGAHSVFNTQARPWIKPDAEPADLVAEVIGRCPSGALQYERPTQTPSD
jgi:uncharacterized Fe-S cluster protein YjdI